MKATIIIVTIAIIGLYIAKGSIQSSIAGASNNQQLVEQAYSK